MKQTLDEMIAAENRRFGELVAIAVDGGLTPGDLHPEIVASRLEAAHDEAEHITHRGIEAQIRELLDSGDDNLAEWLKARVEQKRKRTRAK